ncbi:MAG: site-2 protease family protein [Oscillospiraceae bacterium]
MQNILGGQGLSILARLLAFFTAIPFHEAAHGFISEKLGDPTARNLGRITLNPIKHVDPWGLVAMLTIGIGWAKPVPVNPAYYKKPKVGMAVTAAAGPLSNLLLAYVNTVLFKVGSYVFYGIYGGAFPAAVVVVLTILQYLAYINISLAIFNLLPVPPFDGSRIFALFLPQKAYFSIQKYERYMMFILIAVMFVLPYALNINPIGWLLGTVNTAVQAAFNWATGYIDLIAGLILL